MTNEMGHILLSNSHHPHQFLTLQLNKSVAYAGIYHLTLAATTHGHGYDVEKLLFLNSSMMEERLQFSSN